MMNIKELSPLCLIRIHRDLDCNEVIELWDAVSNNTYNYSVVSLKNLNQITTMLASLKAMIHQSIIKDGMNEQYEHWIERGWGKSLEYYLASKCRTQKDYFYGQQKFFFENKNKSLFTTHNEEIHAILNRRTKRSFQNRTLDKSIFHNSFLKLMTDFQSEQNLEKFTFYFVIYNVSNITPGVYYFNADKSSFLQVQEGNFENYITECLNGLAAPKTGAFTIIQVVNFQDSIRRNPHPKGLRNAFMDAGRIAQKLIIEYGVHGLACLPTPALLDRKICKLLSISESDYAPIYSLTFGFPKG